MDKALYTITIRKSNGKLRHYHIEADDIDIAEETARKSLEKGQLLVNWTISDTEEDADKIFEELQSSLF